MTTNELKALLGRVETWSEQAQEELAASVRAIERRHFVDDELTDEDWKIIEKRAARRDLATDEEVEAVFSRYRSA